MVGKINVLKCIIARVCCTEAVNCRISRVGEEEQGGGIGGLAAFKTASLARNLPFGGATNKL